MTKGENERAFLDSFDRLKSVAANRASLIKLIRDKNDNVIGMCSDLHGKALSFILEQAQDFYTFSCVKDFITEWRNYEENYQDITAGVSIAALCDLDEVPISSVTRQTIAQTQKISHDDAKNDVSAVNEAIGFARRELDFSEEEQLGGEDIYAGVKAGVEILEKLGSLDIDLKGLLYRRACLASFLISPQLAKKYGTAERYSLYTMLEQAKSAFIAGASFATIALLRSIVESVLIKSYGADGKLKLGDMIERTPSLPVKLKRQMKELNDSANNILHFENRGAKSKIPTLEEEKLAIKYFFQVRELVETQPV